MQKNALEKIIEEENDQLEDGKHLNVLFEDGIATIFREKEQTITLLERIPYKINGSINQFRLIK